MIACKISKYKVPSDISRICSFTVSMKMRTLLNGQGTDPFTSAHGNNNANNKIPRSVSDTARANI